MRDSGCRSTDGSSGDDIVSLGGNSGKAPTSRQSNEEVHHANHPELCHTARGDGAVAPAIAAARTAAAASVPTCVSLGASATHCQSPGNVQINDCRSSISASVPLPGRPGPCTSTGTVTQITAGACPADLSDGGGRPQRRREPVLVGDRVFLNLGTHAAIPDVPGLDSAGPNDQRRGGRPPTSCTPAHLISCWAGGLRRAGRSWPPGVPPVRQPRRAGARGWTSNPSPCRPV